MKIYLLLTKILLKAGISNTENKSKKKRKIQIKSKILFLFVFICFIPLLVGLFFIGKEGYNLLNQIGQGGVVIGLLCAASGIMTFVFGISIVISVFYYTSDLEYLLPLPIKPSQIVASKFTITLLYEYITTTILMAPTLIGYGYASSAGVAYYIIALFAVLLIPVVPLIYGGILAMFIMRVFKKAKNRDLMTMVLSIFILVIVLGFNSMSNLFASMEPEAITELLIKGNNSFASIVNGAFPNFILMENALINSDLLMLIFFMLTIIAFVVVFLWLAKILYFKGATGMSATNAKRKAMTKEETLKIVRRRSVIYTYTLKELKLLFRSPMYFMNCVMIAIIWPILFVIPIGSSIIGNASGEANSFSISDIMNNMGANNSLTIAITILAAFVITVFVTSMNFTAGTSISREGKSFFVMKYIPMSYEKQIFAKVLSGIIISVFSTVLYCLIAMLILKLPLFAIVISTIVSLFTCIFFNYLQIVTDLIRPKLNWETEQAAIKQNMNTMFELLFAVIIGGALTALGVVCYIKLNIPINIIGISACIIMFLLMILAHKLITHFGAKRLYSLE